MVTSCLTREYMKQIQLIHGDCLDVMKTMQENSVDLTVTSPPYDKLRTYEDSLEWGEHVWKPVMQELFRLTKAGGVVVWVVGDATIKGSETGTSFKQALWGIECGFNLHDTMIWEKTGRVPTQDRYYNVMEYMFVLSKGKPKAMNFICDSPCVNGGRKQKKDKVINKGKNEKADGYFIRNEFGRRSNIWKIHVGKNPTKHPAIFPEKLANDHILSWSNKDDLVFDPFMGSGTSGKMALKNNRRFIGIEKVKKYFEIAQKRLATETVFVEKGMFE